MPPFFEIRGCAGQPRVNNHKYWRLVREGGVEIKTIVVDTKYIDKEPKIHEEIKRLWKIYQDLPERQRSLAETLVARAAWLHVSLDELESNIDRDGYTTEYQNGANQYGTKKNPDVETHISMSKIWTQVMGQLNDLLPKDKAEPKAGSALKDFTAKRPKL